MNEPETGVSLMNRTGTSTASVPAAMTFSVSQARPTAVAEARDAARAFLAPLRPALTTDAADTIVLVVSELVTNALRHAGGTCSLRLVAHRDSVEVAVTDPSRRPPRLRTPDLNGGTGGFGVPMVHRLARTVTVIPGEAGGKTVRAVLAR